MKITKEVRAKIFNQYYGVKYHYKNDFGTYADLVGSINTYKHLSEYEVVKLVLKPLSEITDEDANKIATLSGFNYLMDLQEFELTGALSCKLYDFCSAYQYLQSKGYDLPQYLLNGKTLKEAGLAIYPTKE